MKITSIIGAALFIVAAIMGEGTARILYIAAAALATANAAYLFKIERKRHE